MIVSQINDHRHQKGEFIHLLIDDSAVFLNLGEDLRIDLRPGDGLAKFFFCDIKPLKSFEKLVTPIASCRHIDGETNLTKERMHDRRKILDNCYV